MARYLWIGGMEKCCLPLVWRCPANVYEHVLPAVSTASAGGIILPCWLGKPVNGCGESEIINTRQHPDNLRTITLLGGGAGDLQLH